MASISDQRSTPCCRVKSNISEGGTGITPVLTEQANYGSKWNKNPSPDVVVDGELAPMVGSCMPRGITAVGPVWNAGISQKLRRNFTGISLFSQEKVQEQEKNPAFQTRSALKISYLSILMIES